MTRLLCALLALVTLGACQTEETSRRLAEAQPPSQEQPSGGDTAKEDPAPAVNPELERRRQQVEAQAKEGIGQSCAQDLDCTLYLRCQSGSCQVPPAMTGQAATEDTPVISLVTSSGEAQFYMELAVSPAEKQRGLMHRPRMDDQWSMLFVYPNEQPLSFWMQNTLIPLDMVFIGDDSRVVGVVEGAEPLTTSARSVSGNSRYVLEINAGLASRYQIKAGDRVVFTRLPAEMLPKNP